MKSARTVAFVIACLILIPAISFAQSSTELIADADQLYDRWTGSFDFDGYRSDLELAIEYYEEALRLLSSKALQSRSNVLNRLARACFELGAAYLKDRDELESIYERGKDYALASLRLDPAFREAETESFRGALAGALDVEAIFWYGNVFGRYVEFHPLTAMMGGMSDIKASFERAIELDAGYLAGGPWRAYASFLAQVPGFLGGDRQAARSAHEEAISLGPTYLENLVNAADFVAEPDGDWDSFCRWLQQAVEQGSDPEVMAEWPLYNTMALRRTNELLINRPCPSP